MAQWYRACLPCIETPGSVCSTAEISVHMNLKNKELSRCGKYASGHLGLERTKDWKVMAKGRRVSLWAY